MLAVATPTSFQLLVFDWDGTLVDSIGRIVECTQASLRDVGIDTPDEERIRMSIGLGIRAMVDSFLPGCDDATFHKICDAYRGNWRETFSRDPVLFDGVREALNDMEDGGYLLAVATAKSRWGLTQDLEATGLTTFFHGSRTADESQSKPHPAMLLELLDEFGVRADQALMVGDTVHDLQMAQNASVAGLGVTTGSHEREDLGVVETIDVLDGVSNMPAWLRELEGSEPRP